MRHTKEQAPDLNEEIAKFKPTQNPTEIELQVSELTTELKRNNLRKEQMAQKVEEVNKTFEPELEPLLKQQREIYAKVNEVEEKMRLARGGYEAEGRQAQQRVYDLAAKIPVVEQQLRALRVFGQIPKNTEEAEAWYSYFGQKLATGYRCDKVIERQPKVKGLTVWGFQHGKWQAYKKAYVAWDNKTGQIVGVLTVDVAQHGGDTSDAHGQILREYVTFEKNYSSYSVKEPLKTWVNALKAKFAPETLEQETET